jgi:hypothetical protein
MKAPLKNGLGLSFNSPKSRVHARSGTAALLCFLSQLRTDTIESRFDASLFARHNFEATLYGGIRRFDLNY